MNNIPLPGFLSIKDSLEQAFSGFRQADAPGGNTQIKLAAMQKSKNAIADNQILDNGINTARIQAANQLLGINSSTVPATLYQQNRKTVNDVFLRMLSTGINQIDSIDAALLWPVAIQCPLEGGRAVVRARNLYSLYKPVSFDSYTCQDSEEREMTGSSQKTLAGDISFSVSPNPVKDGIIYISANRDDVTGFTARLMSIAGNEVHTFTVEYMQKIVQVQLPKTQPGIYFLEIVSSKGDRNVTKLYIH